MKLNLSRSAKRGIAMTEYLVILAIVAIASIVVVRSFGLQVKNVVSNATEAMSGRKGTIAAVATLTPKPVTAGTFADEAGLPQ